MASFQEIHHFLLRVRRRLGWVAIAEAACFLGLTLTVLSAAMLLGAWVVGAEWLEWTRWGGMAIAVLAVLGTLVRYLIRPWFLFRRAAHVARHVEQQLPSFRGDVLSCVELEKSLSSMHAQGRYSAQLIEALARETASKLGSVEPSSLVSWRRTRRFAQVFLLVVLGVSVSATAYPEPFIEGASALVGGVTRLQRQEVAASVEVRDVVVGDITYTFTYPAYSSLPSRVVPNTFGDIAALIGTKVYVETRSLVPAVSALIQFHNSEDTVTMEVTEEGVLRGEFIVRAPDQFSFMVLRPDGLKIQERVRRLVEVTADQAPTIQLLSPVTDLEVQGAEPIVLYFSSADDFGLTRIDMVAEREQSANPAERRRIANLVSKRTHVGQGVLDLSEIGLAPGESVRVWLEAYDNNTILDEPQRTSSRRIWIKLHSPQERHAELVDAIRAIAELMLDRLGDRLESPIEAQSVSSYDTAVNAQNDIARRTESMLTAFSDLIKGLQTDPLTNDTTREDLQEIQRHHQHFHERELHHIQGALGNVRNAERTQHLAVLLRINNSTVEQLERDILLLEGIVEQQHQQRLLEQARSLTEAQRELTELLEELKNTEDPALKMQIQHRIGQLMGQVERLMADLQRNVKEVPYENMNLDALEPGEQMRDLSEMRSALQEMQDALREGRFEEAMALADQLGREIQSLTAALESDLEDMASGSQRVMSEELRDFLSELETISNREEAVHRQTEALKQAALDALSQHVREQLAPRIAEQLEAIQEVANRLARVDVDELHPDDKSQLVISQEAVGDLKETLSQEDLGGGLRMARELVRSLRELEREVEHGVERFREREGDSYRVRRKARNVRRLDRAGDHAQRVVRALEEMMPGPDDLLDRAQQRRLNRLSERQQRVGERVQRLRDRVGAIDAEHPGLGARLDEALQKSEAGMSEATERLSEHRPGPAEVHEQAAMESLRNARQAVERALGNPGRGGGGGLGASRPDNQVAIPDEAQHSVPREFRDELLRGINGRAPRQYRRLIEQYYEVLLQ